MKKMALHAAIRVEPTFLDRSPVCNDIIRRATLHTGKQEAASTCSVVVDWVFHYGGVVGTSVCLRAWSRS